MNNPFSSPTHCPECGSDNLEWHCNQKNLSGVQDGLLRMHDVATEFYLACEACSETLQVISGDTVASFLTKGRGKAGADKTAHAFSSLLGEEQHENVHASAAQSLVRGAVDLAFQAQKKLVSAGLTEANAMAIVKSNFERCRLSELAITIDELCKLGASGALITIYVRHRSETPELGRRIFGYSSCYLGKDVTMLYRLMDSQFLKNSSDVDYWFYADDVNPNIVNIESS